MEMKVGLDLIGNIVLTGMKLWSDERKKSFQKKHFKILEELDQAKNKVFPEYTDIGVSRAKKKYRNFLQAYHLEMSASVQASGGSNV